MRKYLWLRITVGKEMTSISTKKTFLRIMQTCTLIRISILFVNRPITQGDSALSLAIKCRILFS